MSATPERTDIIRLEILEALKHWRWAIIIGTAAVTSLVVILGGVYLWAWQPTRRMASVEFRPTFGGIADVSELKYPNGLDFHPTDITTASVMDHVFETNQIQAYCSREAFREALFAEPRSGLHAILDADYQGRLADARLSTVERRQLVDEYEARRAALPARYRLVYLQPAACQAVPEDLLAKSLTDVLKTWALDSETKRGVLRFNTSLLPSTVFESALGEAVPRVARPDVVRRMILRMVDDIRRIEELPGATVARAEGSDETLGSLRAKLEDLQLVSLLPLRNALIRNGGRELTDWLTTALMSAEEHLSVVESEVQAHQRALREYSSAGVTSVPTPRAEGRATGPTDVTSVTPQLDSTFIDRIVDMAKPNMEFRKELTEGMLKSTLSSLNAQSEVRQFQNLVNLVGRGGGSLTDAQIDARLKAIVDEATKLAVVVHQLVTRYANASLNTAPALYAVESPVRNEVLRAFTVRAYATMVISAFTATLFLSMILAVVARRVAAWRQQAD